MQNKIGVFDGCDVGPVRAALLRRLEAVGYFSVPGAPERWLEVENYSVMSLEQCRQHVREVERLAAKYRRTPPLTMNAVAREGIEIWGTTSRQLLHGLLPIRGLALLQEQGGLEREFVVPFTAKYTFGKPRRARGEERLEF